jgi:transposase
MINVVNRGRSTISVEIRQAIVNASILNRSTQAEIAHSFNVARSTVRSIVRKFNDEGIVTVNKRCGHKPKSYV